MMLQLYSSDLKSAFLDCSQGDTLGRLWKLEELVPGGKSSDHCRHNLKGDCETIVSSSFPPPFSVCEVSSFATAAHAPVMIHCLIQNNRDDGPQTETSKTERQ